MAHSTRRTNQRPPTTLGRVEPRHLESLGRARATIARRLCTVACFYRYAEQEGMIAVSPAAHVRRPRLDYESHATGLDRNEVGAMLVAAGLAGARDYALISLLALNGLRVSEAIGADGSGTARKTWLSLSRRSRIARAAVRRAFSACVTAASSRSPPDG
jgi:site-specific recombinase XerD